MTSTTSRPPIIVYDRDRRALREATETLRGCYEVLATSDPKLTLQWLQKRADLTAIVCDLDGPASIGPKLLEAVARLRPAVRRIGLTELSDLATIVPGLHAGHIQELVQKPFVAGQLLVALRVVATPVQLRKSA